MEEKYLAKYDERLHKQLTDLYTILKTQFGYEAKNIDQVLQFLFDKVISANFYL